MYYKSGCPFYMVLLAETNSLCDYLSITMRMSQVA